MSPKESTIANILKLLSKCYQPRSSVYQIVKRGLSKLSQTELQGLYTMALTSVEQEV